MKKEIVDILEEKFPKEKIKKRPGGFGKTLDYIEAHEVLKRANKAFAGDWSFSVLTEPKDMIIDDNVVVHVRIQYVDPETKVAIYRDGIGGKKIGFLKQNPDQVAKGVPRIPVDLTNDMKAGTSDALKKAFSTFGIALDLYGTDDKDEEHEEKLAEKSAEKVDGPIAETQLKAIASLIRMKKVDGPKWLAEQKVTDVTKITENQAKVIIDALQKVK